MRDLQAGLLSISFAVLVSCGRSPAPAPERASELPTVDVTAAPDAAYSTADDRVERRADPAALAGALPDGFPPDIPVFRPSSLIDFTPLPQGGYEVVFAAPASAAAVSETLGQRLRDAGWKAESGGRWSKGGRKLGLSVEGSAAGSRIRMEF
jgi:hypothetical protein